MGLQGSEGFPMSSHEVGSSGIEVELAQAGKFTLASSACGNGAWPGLPFACSGWPRDGIGEWLGRAKLTLLECLISLDSNNTL